MVAFLPTLAQGDPPPYPPTQDMSSKGPEQTCRPEGQEAISDPGWHVSRGETTPRPYGPLRERLPWVGVARGMPAPLTMTVV